MLIAWRRRGLRGIALFRNFFSDSSAFYICLWLDPLGAPSILGNISYRISTVVISIASLGCMIMVNVIFILPITITSASYLRHSYKNGTDLFFHTKAYPHYRIYFNELTKGLSSIFLIFLIAVFVRDVRYLCPHTFLRLRLDGL